MKHKKIIISIAAVLAMVTLTACTPDNKKETKDTETTVSSSQEVVTGASISDNADIIESALSSNGNWIVAVTDDITFNKNITITGLFNNKGDSSEDIYRKLALYAQDDKQNITDEYTIVAPKLIVESENFNIVHGTVQGDIEVKANGFVLDAAKVDGNITFEKEEYKTSAVLDKDGASVSGKIVISD